MAGPSPPSSAGERPRTARKRTAILDAATAAFLGKGYAGTSMDEIAARASVSKQTLYKHFTDKRHLFTEIVRGTVDDAAGDLRDEMEALARTTDLEADLRELARRQLASALQPRVLQLRRLVIAEAARFPELGRAFYASGAARSYDGLAAAFRQLGARGLLGVDDPDQAARHFNWLVMAEPINRAMLLGEQPAAPELDRSATAGVRVFLAAYGKRSAQGPGAP